MGDVTAGITSVLPSLTWHLAALQVFCDNLNLPALP